MSPGVITMEFRVLKYFLATARTENITAAAKEMNISQPALSRQLMDLENELGVTLLIRSKRSTTLTEAGYLLKRRAEEITELMEKTVSEVSNARSGVSGSIRIGCGETAGMRAVARAVHEIRQDYPYIRCHLYSTDDSGVKERLDKGMLDFGLLVQPEPPKNYPYLEIDHEDTWGVLMRKDSPLSGLDRISAEDLYGLPLIVSRQAFANKELEDWFSRDIREFDIVATYTLIYNAALMAEEGVGYVLCLDRLLTLPPDGALTFRPLSPQNTSRIFFIWKRHQIFSRAASLLIEKLRHDRNAVKPDTKEWI